MKIVRCCSIDSIDDENWRGKGGGGGSIYVSFLWSVNVHPFCFAFNSMGLLRSESCETSVFCLLLNFFMMLGLYFIILLFWISFIYLEQSNGVNLWLDLNFVYVRWELKGKGSGGVVQLASRTHYLCRLYSLIKPHISNQVGFLIPPCFLF